MRLTTAQKVFAVGILGFAGLSAYSNSFAGPYVFDDFHSILNNPTIRQLWPPGEALSPPPDSGARGRPILNVSLALSYGMSGLEPWGFHAFNLAIHIIAAMVLFGLVRRILNTESLRTRFGRPSYGLAFGTALLWMLHPLQTESVTYIIQRAESLMGLFYLLTVYCAVQSFDSRHSGWWKAAAITACALGMGTKEVMASAPIIVLLYERLLLQRSFAAALRGDPVLYAGLGSTWVILGALVATTSHGKLVGFGFENVTPLDYAGTQFGVILHYLRLAIWPRPLCFYYYWPVVRSLAESAFPAAVVVGLAAATVGLWRRQPALSFAGAWFFLILSPSSSVLPIVTEIAAEHRMYLPLAAVISILAAAAYRLLDLRLPNSGAWFANRARFSWVLASVIALFLGNETWQRNNDYRDEITLWTDTVRKQPVNPIALNNLGSAIRKRGDDDAAMAYYEKAIEIEPDYVAARINRAYLLALRGNAASAIEEYREALRRMPERVEAHEQLGQVLEKEGDIAGAVFHYGEVVRLRKGDPQAHNRLGLILDKMGRIGDALGHYTEALRVNADYPEARNNLGVALARLGRSSEAIDQYRLALRLNPGYAAAHANLAAALYETGRFAEAWKEVQLCRKNGGTPPPSLVALLSLKMPEPNP